MRPAPETSSWNLLSPSTSDTSSGREGRRARAQRSRWPGVTTARGRLLVRSPCFHERAWANTFVPGSSRRALLNPGETSLCQGMGFPDVRTLVRWGVAATRRTRHADHARIPSNGLCAIGACDQCRRAGEWITFIAPPTLRKLLPRGNWARASPRTRPGGCSRFVAAACSMETRIPAVMALSEHTSPTHV